MLNQKLTFETRLDLTSEDPNSFLTLVNQSLKNRSRLPQFESNGEKYFWHSEYWNLQQTSLFKTLSDETKTKILTELSNETLKESYFIERCGMYYGAKMSLLSESIQERQFYSMIASDEALHYHWISQASGYLDPESYKTQYFLNFLNQILESESKNILITIIQVVLEGWGLYHYKALSNHCNNVQLKKIFDEIIRDEATHHGGGVTLLLSSQLTDSEIKRLIEILGVFFEMVRCGPQSLVRVLEQHSGGLGYQEKEILFNELGCEKQSYSKIEILKNLMLTAKLPNKILESLEKFGSFNSMNAQECANLKL